MPATVLPPSTGLLLSLPIVLLSFQSPLLSVKPETVWYSMSVDVETASFATILGCDRGKQQHASHIAQATIPTIALVSLSTGHASVGARGRIRSHRLGRAAADVRYNRHAKQQTLRTRCRIGVLANWWNRANLRRRVAADARALFPHMETAPLRIPNFRIARARRFCECETCSRCGARLYAGNAAMPALVG